LFGVPSEEAKESVLRIHCKMWCNMPVDERSNQCCHSVDGRWLSGSWSEGAGVYAADLDDAVMACS